MHFKNDQGPEDPFMSPTEMCQDARISMATWRRTYRKSLAAAGDLFRLSPGRIGVRRSSWRRALERNVERGGV
jgi:hypothetical protein